MRLFGEAVPADGVFHRRMQSLNVHTFRGTYCWSRVSYQYARLVGRMPVSFQERSLRFPDERRRWAP